MHMKKGSSTKGVERATGFFESEFPSSTAVPSYLGLLCILGVEQIPCIENNCWDFHFHMGTYPRTGSRVPGYQKCICPNGRT